MPQLKNVIPSLTIEAKHQNGEAYKLRSQNVTAIRLTTGAPCSSHAEIFAPWPGSETNVVEWYVLDNGYAVGKGVDADGEEFYPVVPLEPNLT